MPLRATAMSALKAMGVESAMSDQPAQGRLTCCLSAVCRSGRLSAMPDRAAYSSIVSLRLCIHHATTDSTARIAVS